MTIKLGGLYWLGNREFWQCFSLRRAAGGRDFLLLSLLFGGVMALWLVLSGVDRGLIDGMARSLIGGGGEADALGLPIAVRGHPELYEGFEHYPEVRCAFTRSTVAEANPSDVEVFDGWHWLPCPEPADAVDSALTQLTFAPFWPIEGSRGDIAFPRGYGIWKAGQGADGEDAELIGWALPDGDPLWDWVQQQGGVQESILTVPGQPIGPPTIVLNAAAFRDFDLDAYRNWLREALPGPIFELLDLPTSAPSGADGEQPRQSAWLDLKELYLLVKLRGNGVYEPVAFRALWVDGLPIMDQTAYLLPMSFYHALKIGQDTKHRQLRFFPEVTADGDATRVLKLAIRPKGQTSQQEAERLQQAVADCLGTGPAKLKTGLDWPLPADWVQACLDRQAIGSSNNRVRLRQEQVSAHRLVHIADLRTGVPCRAIAADNGPDRGQQHDQHCQRSRSRHHPVERASLIAPSRPVLFEAADAIQTLRNSQGERVFFLDPSYLNALDRYRFLTELLGWARLPVIFGLALFAGYIIALGMKSVLDHRRRHYGLMLSRGISIGFIRWLLVYQMTLSALVGASIAAALTSLAWLINLPFADSPTAASGRALGVVGQSVLILPTPIEALAIVGPVWLSGILIALSLAWITGLRANADPIDLIK